MVCHLVISRSEGRWLGCSSRPCFSPVWRQGTILRTPLVGFDKRLQDLWHLALELDVVACDHLGAQALQAHVPLNNNIVVDAVVIV